MRESLQQKFNQGRYRDVLKAVGSKPPDALSAQDFVCWIASLCFTARKEEAEAHFTRRLPRLNEGAITPCRFFLGVAFCRHGSYDKARSYFNENLVRHRGSTEATGFYAIQGIGFYRYFVADYPKAEKWALRASAIAASLGWAYARVLSLDLYGHALAQRGYVTAAIAALNEARSVAGDIGHGGLNDSITISKAVYEAQFGLKPTAAIPELLKLLKAIEPQNSYAKANLLLELANQYAIRGNLREAKASLDEASLTIYQSKHQRYAHLLALRYAQLQFLRGELAEALHSVKTQQASLDVKHDRANFILSLELEHKLLCSLDLDHLAESVAHDLESFKGPSPRFVGEDRILSLANSAASSKTTRLSSRQEIEGILESGYFSYLYPQLKLPHGSSWIIDAGREIFIMDRGQVERLTISLPQQLAQILTLLSSGPKSKAKIIEAVWKYDYHPLRHDALLYQAISRLRTLLKAFGYLVEVTEQGYRLKLGFRFKRLTTQTVEESVGASPEANHDEQLQLNDRQLKILELLQKKPALGMKDLVAHFNVTTMTLKRDLSELVSGNWIVRRGLARATRYSIGSSRQPNGEF